MWYDEAARKLYTIGLFSRESREHEKMDAFLISNRLKELTKLAGDDLCLDSAAAVGSRTLRLKSMLVALFAMLMAMARL